jgi:hypothetical protein
LLRWHCCYCMALLLLLCMALLLRGAAAEFFFFYSIASRDKMRVRKRKMSDIRNLFLGSIS